MVTGIGLVHGRLVAIVANDATVKGGTYYPITVKVCAAGPFVLFSSAAGLLCWRWAKWAISHIRGSVPGKQQVIAVDPQSANLTIEPAQLPSPAPNFIMCANPLPTCDLTQPAAATAPPPLPPALLL
jgi:hypothetical protein